MGSNVWTDENEWPIGRNGGPDDYRSVETRKDLLVFTSSPFRTAVKICRPIVVKLFAATSARDTNWTAMILDVHPDGYAQRLNDGIVRARFRYGDDVEVFAPPGKVEEYDIDAWSTCVEQQPGHRLRLQIASSAAGKFGLNLNTGGLLGQESEGVVAEQTIHHESGRAPYLLVPIVPPKL